MDDPFASKDPLGEALHFLRMSGTFYARSEFTAPWGLELPAFERSMMFHVVTSGRCWLRVDGAEPRLLQQGDFALVPHGEGHVLADEIASKPTGLFDMPRELVSERYEILRDGGGGASTTLLCGAVRFDHPAADRLTAMLPPLVCIDAWSSPHSEWLQSTLRFIAAEARELRPGGETVITRLADILVIQAIRAWIEHDPAARTGWLGALQDKQIGRAITLVHRDPSRSWSVASLASEVAMSRSAFAARFTELVGETPMQYVTRWRMHTAVGSLRDDGATLGEIAGRLGYRSEAAFSRAFKRCVGTSPSAMRRGPST